MSERLEPCPRCHLECGQRDDADTALCTNCGVRITPGYLWNAIAGLEAKVAEMAEAIRSHRKQCHRDA